jgi:hypothetical protein
LALKVKKQLLLNRKAAYNGLAQVGLDGRAMSSGNAAVQQSQQDVNYLAMELNLYISISIGIGTGLDVKKCPTWTPSRTVNCNAAAGANPIKLIAVFRSIFFQLNIDGSIKPGFRSPRG